MNAFTDAYNRLLHARANPPSREQLAEIEKQRAEDERAERIKRFRKSVA